MTDPYQHMEEVWGWAENPFPGEAISSSLDEPHSTAVFPEEETEFRVKALRGGLQGGRKVAYLWSIGEAGGDTGFGKSSLMRSTARAINEDMGEAVQAQMGIAAPRRKRIVAAYAEVNEQSRSGLYPVLVAAAQNMASGPLAVLPQAREIIADEVGDDYFAIQAAVMQTRLELAPSGPPIRQDLLEPFARGADQLADALSRVTEATQMRSGIQHFAFAIYVLAAAKVKKCFLFIDQLEDLGKKGALTAGRRRREVGRIRDFLEIEPYASLLHLTFTLHHAAAGNLRHDWEANRLPEFDPVRANSSSVVRLEGLQNDPQVETLLRAWMEPGYLPGSLESVAPFDVDGGALTALRLMSEGRPGYVLRNANELWMAAAENGLATIDGEFVRSHLSGEELPSRMSGVGTGEDDGSSGSSLADELLS